MKTKPAALLVPLVILPTFTTALYIPTADTSSLSGRDTIDSQPKGNVPTGSEPTPVVRTSPSHTTKIPLPQTSNKPTPSMTALPGKPQEYQFKKEATKKLAQLATSLIDLIVPAVILSTSSGIIWYLHRHNDHSGLIAGAAASAGVVMLIQADDTASQPLLIAAAATYIGFHTAYCKVVAKSLEHADGFIAVTIVVATAMLTVFAHLPSITNLWKESSGVPMLWAIFPLHIISVFFSSFTVRVTRRYLE
ncbi:hypothetical protein BU25DRAFT_91685 [Macroventuria anomochaeta]|uniref:Uncharacterized protein n=1 Tax=Macroventuria anomochaeta TaxID=301207 RepID=A0ACB6RXL3_9PLEO|nr:uncharacterized protein BU25DRAFT_91685 [Macroventuria anomochaeta]KAF2626611.1 hypothetical protein BU25DRAFT_91685 [Macroventuria anomochaeta]